jgi:hypothetical protein
MKKFISLSAGVESTTMCLLYGKGATAIFSDAGDEDRENKSISSIKAANFLIKQGQ